MVFFLGLFLGQTYIDYGCQSLEWRDFNFSFQYIDYLTCQESKMLLGYKIKVFLTSDHNFPLSSSFENSGSTVFTEDVDFTEFLLKNFHNSVHFTTKHFKEILNWNQFRVYVSNSIVVDI